MSIKLNLRDNHWVERAYINFAFEGQRVLGPERRRARTKDLKEQYGIIHTWVPEDEYLHYEQFIEFPDEATMVQFVLAHYYRVEEE